RRGARCRGFRWATNPSRRPRNKHTTSNARSEAENQPRPSCPDISPPRFHNAQAFIRNTRSWRSRSPGRTWPEEQTPSSVLIFSLPNPSFAHSTSVPRYKSTRIPTTENIRQKTTTRWWRFLLFPRDKKASHTRFPVSYDTGKARLARWHSRRGDRGPPALLPSTRSPPLESTLPLPDGLPPDALGRCTFLLASPLLRDSSWAGYPPMPPLHSANGSLSRPP
ncbi:unnamed protein product, partial [Ectocarpus sp. 12 AP-2014]